MKRWLLVIVSLFAALGVTTGAMAHIAELGFGTSAVASVGGDAGFSKKSDEGKSDPAKASAKLHGCHGHHIAIPLASAPEPEAMVAVKAVPARNGTSLAPPTHSDTFRPPIA